MLKENHITELFRVIDRNSYFDLLQINALFESFKGFQTLTENQHNLTIFDSMIQDIAPNIKENLKHGIFYTGWNFFMKAEQINGRTKLIPKCEKLQNLNIYHPIWIIFFNSKNVENVYASMNVRNIDCDKNMLDKDAIYIQINENTIDDLSLLKASLKYELTHAVQSYCKNNFNNLSSKENTIGYGEENYFSLSNDDFDFILQNHYFFNKSEQEAFINRTITYLEENYSDKLKRQNGSFDTIKLIQNSFKTSKIDQFENFINNLEQINEKLILVFGFYLQLHHYIYGSLTKEYIKHVLNVDYQLNKQDKQNIKEIKKACQYFFQQYRQKLFNAIYAKNKDLNV